MTTHTPHPAPHTTAHAPHHAEKETTEAPKPISFSPAVQAAVKELGYDSWTPIQEMTIPLIQAGKDVIGQSHTGSGKTAAFGLPIVEKIAPNTRTQVLILVPTRELCEQVMLEMRKFAKHKRMSITAVYGGMSMGPQIHHLRRTDIVVGTPGRVLDHLERGTFNPNSVNTLVLDEADRMLDMGFIRDMKKIMQRVPAHRQTLLFSATMSPEVHDIAKHFMKKPEMVKAQSYVDAGKLTHHYYDLDQRANHKFGLLLHVLQQEKPELAIVFCGTRRMVDKVEKNLNENGVPAHAIHGGLSQNQRKRALDDFHQGKFHVLVASDVAARGLDIKSVSHVINYDIPRNASEYIHRSGRTARAGEEGKIISLLAPQDYEDFRAVLRDKSLAIQEIPLPEFSAIEIASRKGPHSPTHGHGGHGGYGGRGGQGGHSRGREEGRRFFPKKNQGETRSFEKRSFHRNEEFPLTHGGRGPDSAQRRRNLSPHPNRRDGNERPADKPIVKHFSLKHAPKDEK